MVGQTVNDILTSFRPEANRLGFGRMIQALKFEVAEAWAKPNRQRSSDSRHAAAIRHVALIQTHQQLGQYDEANQSWRELRGRLDIDSNVPDALRRTLGEEVGDHAATVFFHLGPAKSQFDTPQCQDHLDVALEQLKRPANRAEFYWRHCMNDLVAGRSVDFGAEKELYLGMTADGNPLVAHSVMRALESLQYSLLAGAAGGRKLEYAEAALWLYLESTQLVEASGSHLDHPNLTTHTILCSVRHAILLRRRIDFLKRVNDQETEYRLCLKLVDCLMEEAGISPKADGFRENTAACGRFIDECRPWEPTSRGVDSASIAMYYHGTRAAKLSRIVRMAKSLL